VFSAFATLPLYETVLYSALVINRVERPSRAFVLGFLGSAFVGWLLLLAAFIVEKEHLKRILRNLADKLRRARKEAEPKLWYLLLGIPVLAILAGVARVYRTRFPWTPS